MFFKSKLAQKNLLLHAFNFYRLKTNDTVTVWTMRQLITLWYIMTNRKPCWIRTVIIGVSVIKRFSLYEFSLWGWDFMSVVRIIEVPYYRLRLFLQRMYGHFPRTKWTVRIREVSIRRGSTVYAAAILYNNKIQILVLNLLQLGFNCSTAETQLWFKCCDTVTPYSGFTEVT